MLSPKRPLSLTEILIGGLAFGILVAVVVPAAQQASETGELAKCRSNLYEIGQATFRYAADNGGRTPPNLHNGEPYNLFGTIVGGGRTYGLLLAKRHGGWGPVDYISRPQHLFCPSNDPDLWETYDYKNPDEVHEGNQISRMGYMSVYFISGDRRSNASVYEDPRRPMAFDLGAGQHYLHPMFTLPSHSSVLNVLHLGGHLSTVSIHEANAHSSLLEVYDWITYRSRVDDTNPLTGGDDQ